MKILDSKKKIWSQDMYLRVDSNTIKFVDPVNEVCVLTCLKAVKNSWGIVNMLYNKEVNGLQIHSSSYHLLSLLVYL